MRTIGTIICGLADWRQMEKKLVVVKISSLKKPNSLFPHHFKFTSNNREDLIHTEVSHNGLGRRHSTFHNLPHRQSFDARSV